MFDLSGLAIRVRGLPHRLAARLETEWAAFLAPAGPEAFLDVQCVVEPEADDPRPFAPKAMTASFAAGAARYAIPQGEAEVPADGTVRIRLDASTAERQFYTLVNLLCAATAFRLPSHGGALLHAAGAVVHDRAFVLVGPEGSGKTTWVLVAKAAGAVILSDDLVVVASGVAGGLEALGSPFRSRQHGLGAPGRWPVAAFLLPRHGDAAALAPVSGLLARGRLLANLPFLAEAAAFDPRVEMIVDALASGTPVRTLTFARDPAFVPLLAAFTA